MDSVIDDVKVELATDKLMFFNLIKRINKIPAFNAQE